MSGLFKHYFTRRAVLKGAAASLGTATLGGCAISQQQSQKQPSKLAIIHTNDTHGHVVLDDESLGLAAVCQLRSDYEAKGYEVLLLDAGDIVQGENVVNHSKGMTGIDLFNQCGYDAVALGNHEFDYGQSYMYEYVEMAHFPMLSANVLVEATNQPMFAPYTTFTLADGTKVGVFGLTTPQTYTKASPLLTRGFIFLERDGLIACAQEQANMLRSEGCSLIVCLAHLGEADEAIPNRAQDVAAATVGIDLIIDGHDHEEEHQIVKNAAGKDVLIVEADCYTHEVGVVKWENGTLEAGLERFGEYTGQDAAIASYAQEAYDQAESTLSEVVGHTAFLLDGESDPGVRTKETNLGDLVADSMMWEAQQMADDAPDCAIINGGSIRTSIEEGDVTTGSILNVAPFLNYICTVQVTGAQLLEALEASTSVTPQKIGGFPQVSGIKITVDTSVPFESEEEYPGSTYGKPAKPGSRVTIEDVGGKGFSLEETYTIASTDFCCSGGDTYYVFAEAARTTMKSINYLVNESITYFIKEALNGEVPEEYKDPNGQGRITIK